MFFSRHANIQPCNGTTSRYANEINRRLRKTRYPIDVICSLYSFQQAKQMMIVYFCLSTTLLLSTSYPILWSPPMQCTVVIRFHTKVSEPAPPPSATYSRTADRDGGNCRTASSSFVPTWQLSLFLPLERIGLLQSAKSPPRSHS